jgi:signal transduction histidine kinase
MIMSIMHHPKSMIETTTQFIKMDPVLHQESALATFYFTNTGMSLVVGISKDVILKEINKDYNMIIWITLLITILATILGYFLLKKYFVLPLESVNEQLENSMLEDGHYRFLECEDKGEIGQLVYNLNFRTLALEDSQRREKEEIQKRITNEKLLIQQSKMAAMGEMMDAVAHQWKQPLNALSMYSEIIRSDFEEGSVDQKYVDEFSRNIQIQIDHMVDTLDEFRSFFRPNKENEVFTVSKVIDSVLFLTKDEFMKNRIMVTVEIENDIELLGSKNEFKHLILNIINNAKDAFNDNGIQEKRIITIRLLNDEKGKRIEIEDNAGGIPEDVLPDIFKANVTTKEEGKGTGIGLYMSMQIAEKYGAKLLVENLKEGACFTILFEA